MPKETQNPIGLCEKPFQTTRKYPLFPLCFTKINLSQILKRKPNYLICFSLNNAPYNVMTANPPLDSDTPL